MAKFIVLLFVLSCTICGSSAGRTTEKNTRKALQVIRKNIALLDTIKQILVVFNETPEDNSATLVAFEKREEKWKVISPPMIANIGLNGFAAPGKKREGDGMSPTGFFRLGQLFSYEKEVDTPMSYIQTNEEDKWIDDSNSIDYNKYVKGLTEAKSYENLKLASNVYKYCMVIEYNTNPVIKGMGSAIFFHLNRNETQKPTAGCVAINEKDMKQILKWMSPDLKPSILMGTLRILNSGLKNFK